MKPTSASKRQKGSSFLLVLVGFYFAVQFYDLDSTTTIIGMLASLFLIGLGLYTLIKRS